MSKRKILFVLVRGWNDKSVLSSITGTGSGIIPEGLRQFVEQKFEGSDVIAPDLPMGFASVASPFEVASVLSQKIEEAFNPDKHDQVRLLGYSAGAPIARYALARAMGFDDAGNFSLPVKPWAERVERIVFLSGILRGWSISTATPAKIRFFSPISSLAVRTWCRLRHWRTPFIWQLRRHAPFISLSRLLDIEREKWCKENKKRVPAKVVLLGTQDEFISPVDCIEFSSSKTNTFAELSGLSHSDMLDVSKLSAEATDNKFCKALGVSPELLAKDKHFAIDPDDINDYFDPLDRPGLHAAHSKADGVKHAVMILHGIRDEGFWTKRVAKYVKLAGKGHDGKASPIFLRAPTPSYGFFSMLDFVRPWVRRRQAEWFLDKYAEVRDCYREAKISFIGHSNGTYLAAYILETCAAVRLKNIYFAGSVVRTDYPWHARAGQVNGKVVNAAARDDNVIAILPGAMERLGLKYFGVGGAGFSGFAYQDTGKDANGASVSQHRSDWLYNLSVSGDHGGGKKEELWSQIAEFVVQDVVPPRATTDPLDDRNKALRVFAVPLFLLLIAGVVGFGCFLGVKTIQPLWEHASMLDTSGAGGAKPSNFAEHITGRISLFWAASTVAFVWLVNKFLRFF